MSKTTETKRGDNTAEYNSSSAPTVLIVLAISVLLAFVAILGTTA